MLHFAFNNNIIKQKGRNYYIPGFDNIGFTKKNFSNIANENPQIINALYDLCLPYLRNYMGGSVGDGSDNIDDKSSYVSVLNSLEIA